MERERLGEKRVEKRPPQAHPIFDSGESSPSPSEIHLPLNSDEDIYVCSPADNFYWASARQVFFPVSLSLRAMNVRRLR